MITCKWNIPVTFQRLIYTKNLNLASINAVLWLMTNLNLNICKCCAKNTKFPLSKFATRDITCMLLHHNSTWFYSCLRTQVTTLNESVICFLYFIPIMVDRASNPPTCRWPAGVTTSGRPAARAAAIASTKCSYECPGRVAELLFCGNSECASSNDKGVHL